MHKTIALLVLIALSASAWGQDSTQVRNRMQFGLSLAGGAQREFQGNSDYSTQDQSGSFSYDLNWEWRGQAGIIGDYRLGKSRFGIRWGLAFGLRQVKYSWICTVTNPNDALAEPWYIRFNTDQLDALADLKASLRYSSRGERPWILLLGGHVSRFGGISGNTTKIATGAIDHLFYGLSRGVDLGFFTQLSKQFPFKWGVLEPAAEARLQMHRVGDSPSLREFCAMVGLQFWPGLK